MKNIIFLCLYGIIGAFENFITGPANIPERLRTCEVKTRMIGGTKADKLHWKWIVHIQFNTGEQCGGSIIHDRWILTAAHCCDGKTSALLKFAVQNSHSDSERGQFEMFVNPPNTGQFVIHKEYYNARDRNPYNSDYCLVQTATSIFAKSARHSPDGTARVAQACLPKNNYTPGDWCWVAGWGTTETGKMSHELLENGFNLFSREYCHAKSNYVKPGVGFYIGKDEICVGIPDRDNDGFTDAGNDTCQGDSGGPLICNVGGSAVLVGTVSWGMGCGRWGYPGLFANVFTAKGWIQKTIQEETQNFDYVDTDIPRVTNPITRTTKSPIRTTRATTVPYSAGNGVYEPNTYTIWEDGTFRFNKIVAHPPPNLGSCNDLASLSNVGNGFPWIVHLFFSDMVECTGTIIGSHEIITGKSTSLF